MGDVIASQQQQKMLEMQAADRSLAEAGRAPLVTTPAMPWDLLHPRAAAMPAKWWSDASMHVRQPPPCSASGLAEADLAPCTPHAHRLSAFRECSACLLSPTCCMPQSLT